MGADIEGVGADSNSAVKYYTVTHTWTSGSGDEETITHNLGTTKLIVSCKDIGGSSGYSDNDNQMDIGNDTFVRPLTDNSFDLGFGSNVNAANGDQFLITVIGVV